MSGFWGEDCPAREPALSHAHARECLADHGGVHEPNQCCHCGQIAGAPTVKVSEVVGLSPEEAAHLAFTKWRLKRLRDGGS